MIVNISHKSAAKLHKTIEMPAPFHKYFSKKMASPWKKIAASNFRFTSRCKTVRASCVILILARRSPPACHSDRAKRRKNPTTQ